jgi:hypothetical protein
MKKVLAFLAIAGFLTLGVSSYAQTDSVSADRCNSS